MKFYSFDEIRAAGSCLQFVTQCLRLQIQVDRCQATWRGGDGWNVAVSDREWYDHKAKVGGGILELCATALYQGDLQQAQEYLGQWLGLAPACESKHLDAGGSQTRYDQLIKEGYQEVCRYDYQDLDGKTVHTVVRMKHPGTGKKEFLQRTPAHWGLGDTKPILYRQADWVASSWVIVVEGEKDVETCRALGLPATTNCGGAEKWRPEYAELFAGKDVVILRDNDEAGQHHARVVSRALATAAGSIRILCPSKLPKGDVTDWLEQEGGTREALLELLAAAPTMDPAQAVGTDDEWALAEAKKANAKPFSNTFPVRRQLDTGGVKIDEEPRQINELIEDCHRRFIGFPRRVGDGQLFDHDRDSRRIEWIYRQASLFAWIQSKSKKITTWNKKEGCVTKEEFFEGLTASAIRYEAISYAPDWPRRRDVYYAHEALPPPDPEHRWFHGLAEFFAPASPACKTLLKAFLAAPIFYQDGIPRPCWIIDSEDGPGTGKTTLVEMVAQLYSGSPLRTSKQELRSDCKELIKRIVSSEGRNARILLVDNVTGTFSVPEFSDLVTAKSISGKPPYGRGEEVRPNNLTYVITANSANLDNDVASRSYYLAVKRPSVSATWKRDLMGYIEENRLRIFADLLDLLSRHEPFADIVPVSRFPEFETMVLQAVCRDLEEYNQAAKAIIESRSESNVEEELAKQVEEAIRFRLINLKIQPDTTRAFIRSDALAKMLIGIENLSGRSVQEVRNMAKIGLLSTIDKKTWRFPANKAKRRHGIMWVGESCENDIETRIIGLDQEGKISVVDSYLKSPFDTRGNESGQAENNQSCPECPEGF